MLNKALVKNSNCWDLAIYKNSWEVKIDTAEWKTDTNIIFEVIVFI